MSTHRVLTRIGFIVATCLGMGSLTICPSARAACTGPASLEARIRAHPDADAYAALGAWFEQNRQTECAVEAYRSALKWAPDSAQLDYLLGRSLFASGRLQEAIAPLQQSAQRDPEQLKTHLLLGAALSHLGRNQEALIEWKAALKIDPYSKAALDGQAKCLIATGDYETVIRSLRSAARDESMTLDLALAFRKTGMLDDAAETLNEGLRADPGSDALTAALVSLQVDESHYEAATSLAEEIARTKADDLEAQRIYFRTLVITGDNDRAAALGRKLLALAPHDADLLNLNGLLEKKAGDYQTARKHLEEAVDLSPNDYNPRVNLGVVLAALNDPAGAKIQLEKALALGTDEPQVHFELAKVLRALGDTAGSEQQLTLYQQKLKQESDRTFAVSKAAEAALAAKAGDNQKAADLYRQACAAQPNDPAMAYQLALVLDNLGEVTEERAALQQAIQANSHFVLAQYQLGYMDFQAGDNAGAERQFRLTVEEVPDNVQAWISLAAALGAQSRFDEAQEVVAHALKLDPSNAAALGLSRKLAASQNQH
ncbi:MAG TPA: tetratricopeptide repeat protein [Terracidiphilus sp.]|nr:tetratricopeptide repeat protein [Terracidiphilus sp.]